METEEIWVAEVLKRMKHHPFANGDGPGGLSPAVALLKAIYRLHSEIPSYSCIEPLLPVLPTLPLDDSWVELYLHPDHPLDQPGSLRTGNRRCSLEPDYSIREILRSPDSAILLGDPGSGKTTILKWAARYLLRNPHHETPIPFFLPLDRFVLWKRTNPQKSIYHFFWEAMLELPREFGDQFHAVMEDADTGPSNPRLLFRMLLDGPNELTETTRTDLVPILQRLQCAFPTVFATRSLNYGRQLPPWRHYYVAPLRPQGVRALIHALAARP